MKILITGGSGMIGRHLIPVLKNLGHEVINVSRHPRREAGEISWDDPFPAVDAAIHLAGARVVDKRWSPAYIHELYTSRADTAEKLKSKLTPSCKIILTASGSNAYAHGNFTSAPADENSAVDPSHELGRLCAAWEAPWKEIPWPSRVVALRIGFVVSPDDSGIQTMLPIYKAGLGGVIGSGRQRISWIALDDLLRVFILALTNDNLRGPVNVVAPAPVTFKAFNDAFAKAVHRWAFWPIPAFVMRLAYGRLADEMILADTACVPLRLQQVGFQWHTPDIYAAMQAAVQNIKK